jgi:hypothetical protein
LSNKKTHGVNGFAVAGFRWLASDAVASKSGFPGFRKRIHQARAAISQAFDNESLFLIRANRWIPSGFPGEEASR